MVPLITTIFFISIVVISYMKRKRATESEINKDIISYHDIGLTMCDGKKEEK